MTEGTAAVDSTLAVLATRARAGDGDAFVELMETLQLNAYRMAAAILADSHEAQDAVQEATVRAWRSIAKLRDARTVDAWFRTIVVNECRRSHRGSWRRMLPFGLHHAAAAPPESDALELGVVVRQTLARLHLDHRVVLVLHHYFDVSLSDIAEELGIPLGTVKSRLSRASQQFTKAYVAATKEMP